MKLFAKRTKKKSINDIAFGGAVKADAGMTVLATVAPVEDDVAAADKQEQQKENSKYVGLQQRRSMARVRSPRNKKQQQQQQIPSKELDNLLLNGQSATKKKKKVWQKEKEEEEEAAAAVVACKAVVEAVLEADADAKQEDTTTNVANTTNTPKSPNSPAVNKLGTKKSAKAKRDKSKEKSAAKKKPATAAATAADADADAGTPKKSKATKKRSKSKTPTAKKTSPEKDVAFPESSVAVADKTKKTNVVKTSKKDKLSSPIIKGKKGRTLSPSKKQAAGARGRSAGPAGRTTKSPKANKPARSPAASRSRSRSKSANINKTSLTKMKNKKPSIKIKSAPSSMSAKSIYQASTGDGMASPKSVGTCRVDNRKASVDNRKASQRAAALSKASEKKFGGLMTGISEAESEESVEVSVTKGIDDLSVGAGLNGPMVSLSERELSGLTGKSSNLLSEMDNFCGPVMEGTMAKVDTVVAKDAAILDSGLSKESHEVLGGGMTSPRNIDVNDNVDVVVDDFTFAASAMADGGGGWASCFSACAWNNGGREFEDGTNSVVEKETAFSGESNGTDDMRESGKKIAWKSSTSSAGDDNATYNTNEDGGTFDNATYDDESTYRNSVSEDDHTYETSYTQSSCSTDYVSAESHTVGSSTMGDDGTRTTTTSRSGMSTFEESVGNSRSTGSSCMSSSRSGASVTTGSEGEAGANVKKTGQAGTVQVEDLVRITSTNSSGDPPPPPSHSPPASPSKEDKSDSNASLTKPGKRKSVAERVAMKPVRKLAAEMKSLRSTPSPSRMLDRKNSRSTPPNIPLNGITSTGKSDGGSYKKQSSNTGSYKKQYSNTGGKYSRSNTPVELDIKSRARPKTPEMSIKSAARSKTNSIKTHSTKTSITVSDRSSKKSSRKGDSTVETATASEARRLARSARSLSPLSISSSMKKRGFFDKYIAQRDSAAAGVAVPNGKAAAHSTDPRTVKSSPSPPTFGKSARHLGAKQGLIDKMMAVSNKVPSRSSTPNVECGGADQQQEQQLPRIEPHQPEGTASSDADAVPVKDGEDGAAKPAAEEGGAGEPAVEPVAEVEPEQQSLPAKTTIIEGKNNASVEISVSEEGRDDVNQSEKLLIDGLTSENVRDDDLDIQSVFTDTLMLQAEALLNGDISAL